MKLRASLNGTVYNFTGITDVLAKANEPKSADRLQRIAAETNQERVAARVVLSELTVQDLTENPTIPYEDDEVTRVNLDGLNQPGHERMRAMTLGELREWILSYETTPDVLARSGRCFTGEVAAGVAKLMTAMDLVYAASKIRHITQCNTAIGHAGTIAYRCQTNSTTDDPETIVLGLAEGVSYGCGDACLGINPVNDDAENTKRIAEAVYDFMTRNEIPTQVVVLSHITTQMEAGRRGAPLSMAFQSIAGFGRFFRPFMVNNVSGFIGPETLYDGKEMIRANLEDHFMASSSGGRWAWRRAGPTTPRSPWTTSSRPRCCSP